MNTPVKYPRTYHLPWSKGITKDDCVLKSDDIFEGKRVVVLEKMDGENCNAYNDRIHARSLDTKDHPSRHWVKNLWYNFRMYLPDGWRVCGENLYAKHSIHYTNLESFFLVFSIWDNEDCLNWDDTVTMCHDLKLYTVPVIWEGIYNRQHIMTAFEMYRKNREVEGYVVRLYDEFKLDDFNKSVAKFVRENHVQTDEHWMTKEVIPNLLTTQ